MARVPRALEGEVRGGSSLEGAGKGRLWRKGSRKGGRWRRATRQRALIPSFLPVNVLVNLIAVNQMDPYDSDSSDGGPEFPSQSTIPEPPPFNDPNYETYKHGQQFLIVDHTANQRNGSEISKIWQHGGERRRVDYGTTDRYLDLEVSRDW